MAAALALAAPVPAAGQARPRDPGSAPSSGSSGSSGESGRVSGGSSGGSGHVQAAPRVGSSRSGSSRSGGSSSVRERSVPPSSSGVRTGSRARPRGEGSVVAGTPGSAVGATATRGRRTGDIVGRAVPRSSRPPILRPPNRWYYPGWSPISYYSPWLYGTYGLGYYFYDPWWLIWGPAYGPWGYGYDPYGYGYGYGYGGYGGGGGGYYGGRSTTVSDYGQVRLKVKPADAEVFVDGVRKGEVGEFDGVWERLEVPFGTHVIEVRREGYKSRAWDVTLQSKDLVTIKGELSRD